MNAVYSQLEIGRRINLLIFKRINRINLLTFGLANFVLYFEFLFSKFSRDTSFFKLYSVSLNTGIDCIPR